MTASTEYKKHVTLSCGHSTLWGAPWPKFGETVYCRRCVDYRRVRSVIDEYRVRCGQCPLSRAYGQDLEGAQRVASRHVMKFSHTVTVWEGNRVVETIAPQGDSLPYDSVLAKRTRNVKEHQRALLDYIDSLPNRDVSNA